MLTFELAIWYLKKIQEAVFGVAHIKHKALKAMYLAYVDIRLPSALCTSITPFRPIGHIVCAQNFPDSYLRLPGILLNYPFCCMPFIGD